MKKTLVLSLIATCSLPALAQDYNFSTKGLRVIEPETPAKSDVDGIERFNIHFQTTYVYQYKPAFHATYQGTNGLDSAEETQNSLTATLYLGARLWKGAQAYVNPELAGGSGLSGALGMGGSSNGETFRVGNPAPALYLGRAYIQQTFTLGNKAARLRAELNTEQVESDANQLAGYEPKNYLRFYAGKFSLGDLFDNNEYSNSPRTQFMNWALMNNGAWDYAANTRGYTYAFVSELQLGKMNYKAGIATLPKVANGPELNTDLGQAYAINAEISRTISIARRPGNIRILGFYNSANMGNYNAAIMLRQNGIADITHVRSFGNTKYGFGINFDQEISNTFGVFGRLGWNDGENETWCFTEIDKTFSLGLVANGKAWGRPNDNCGIAFVGNGLSRPHRDYLYYRGVGFIVGDGRLNYSPEAITELYYSFRPLRQGIWFTGDYQFCMHPGYAADRGPVHIFSLRLHVEI